MTRAAPDKSQQRIQGMFDEIAPTYDKLNHLFTLNLDVKWRKEIADTLLAENVRKEKILDLATGTGDLTIQLLNLNPVEIIGADFSQGMLDIQHAKISDSRLKLIRADASKLPFPDNYFDIITIGFGVRNFENLSDSLQEIRRVLNPDGLLVIIEMFSSNNFVNSIFNLYFGKLMPFIGNKISKSNYAYRYLFESVKSFFTVKEFVKICCDNRFKPLKVKNNFLKVVNTVYLKKT